ncbi:MAG: glycosyltransferase family 39 protein [Candidatus Omnitrophota bacterium]|jgi:4-amino-4-deoxy-L-arabinose transferase-like glycosyltransferase
MMSARTKSFVIYAVLLILVISGFYIRINNYRKSATRTIDELVFYHLGAQLKNHFPSYHTRDFARLLLEIRPHFAPLPKYFTQPLFKHPPLFPAFISLSLRILGEHYYSAAFVAAFFGVLMILLTYWIGELVFDECVGLAAAFLVWLDPINIISSQKIWMDTTVGFFMLLAVFFFLRGMKYQDSFSYAGFGLASGCALLTKYTGILTLLSAGLYFALFNKKFFRQRCALSCFGLPLLLLAPWMIWNACVYGRMLFNQILDIHNLSTMTVRSVSVGTFLLGIICLGTIGLFVERKPFSWVFSLAAKWAQRHGPIKRVVLGLFLIVFGVKFFSVLGPNYRPATYWEPGHFAEESRLFYIKRLPEFSLFYLVSFLALFSGFRDGHKHGPLILKLFSGMILVFFSLWKNYQTRYILAATPLLLILGAALWLKIIKDVCQYPGLKQKWVGVITTSLVSVYILFKIFYVNMVVSFPNDMCYF